MLILLMILFFTIIVVFCAYHVVKYKINHPVDKRHLKDSIDQEVRKFTRRVSPNALMIGVYKDGRTHFQCYGEGEPNSSTLFQIGSVSKLFTSCILMKLCDEGSIDLDSTIDDIIGNQVVLSDEVKRVTLYQLVSHTSGFPRVPKQLLAKLEKKVGKENLLDNPYLHIKKEDVLQYLSSPEDKQPPGKFEYSNYGMGLLGHLLELKTGKSLEQLAKEKLFQPLAMDDTVITLDEKMKQRLVQGHSKAGNPVQCWGFNALAGAGAFYSTPNDLLIFMTAFLENNASVVNLKRMTCHQDNIGWIKPGFIEYFFGNNDTVWHNGLVGGYSSYIAVDPSSQSGVVILSNQSIDLTMLGIMLVRQIRTQSRH